MSRPNDLVHFACLRAVRSYGGSDGTFNGANFAMAMIEISGCNQTLDGAMVRAILGGRSDVEPLNGVSHYRLVER